MKKAFCAFMGLALAAMSNAQSSSNATDSSLINLQTPVLLSPSKSTALVDLRYVGGYDKTLHGNLGYAYGISKGWELDVAAALAKWNSAPTPGGSLIRFGGTDEEVSLRYALPTSIPLTVQAGLGYAQTPAQKDRLAASLGASLGYAPCSKARLYLNPRAVFLDDNTLVGIGVGAIGDLSPNLSLTADWTPLVAGNNTINPNTGGRDRAQLYSVGLRFNNLVKNGSVDLGITNSSGITTGSSLTPVLGDSLGYFVRLSYRF